MAMLVRLVQLENASEPMVVKELPKVNSERLEQYANAYPPIVSTLFGIVTLVRLVQPENALLGILDSPSEIVA